MKIFSFIFSFYLLLLAFEPGIKALSFSEEIQSGCCNDKSCKPLTDQQSEKKKEKKGCDDNNNCNPFQNCKTCTAFTVEFAFHDFTPIVAFVKPQANNKERVPSLISLDFWQPPKIV